MKSHPSPPGRGAGGEGTRKKLPMNPKLLAIARNLRQRQTDAESLLWAMLRNRRLEGLKFRRQHPIGRYVLDFYCPDARLAVELDGEQHGEDVGQARDAEREAFLLKNGIRTVRFWNHEVLTELEWVLETIFEQFELGG